MKKGKIVSLLLVLLMVCSVSVPVFAGCGGYCEAIHIRVFLENDYGNMDWVPCNDDIGRAFIDENNRTQVPIRAFAETCGWNVWWEPLDYIGKGVGRVCMEDSKSSWFIRSDAIYNGKSADNAKLYVYRNAHDTNVFKAVTMDTYIRNINGRIYAPARFVADALGYKVGYDELHREVIVDTGNFTSLK